MCSSCHRGLKRDCRRALPLPVAAFSGPRPRHRPEALYHLAFINDFFRNEVLTYSCWSFAKDTDRTYSRGEERFINFCLMNHLISPTGHVLPTAEGTLVYSASYLARTVQHSTIKLYLAAVRNLHITTCNTVKHFNSLPLL